MNKLEDSCMLLRLNYASAAPLAQAFLLRKLKIKGSMGLAMKLVRSVSDDACRKAVFVTVPCCMVNQSPNGHCV